MENTRLVTALPKFVEQVLKSDGEQDRPLRVHDLRLGIRSIRMTEISEWSDHDLDILEVHAAPFDGNALLESVLSLPVEGDPATYAASVSSICSPSPYAWT